LKGVKIALAATPAPTVQFKEANGEVLAMVHVTLNGKYNDQILNIGADVTVSAKLTKGSNDDPKTLVVYTITYGLSDIKNISFAGNDISESVQKLIEGLIKASAKKYTGSTNIPIPKLAWENISLASLELMVKDGHLLGQVGLNV
jgi:hypothetical protein